MRFVELTEVRGIEDLISALPQQYALDTESTGLNPRIDTLKRIIISPDGEVAYSFSPKFLPLLVSAPRPKLLYIQNFKHDYQFLYHAGWDLLDVDVIDPMLLHHIVDETKEHSLDFMVKQFYADSYKEEFWAKYKTYEEAPRNEALEYECKDAIYHYRVAKKLLKLISEHQKWLVEHVHRLAKALLYTELHGVRVDLDLMRRTQVEMSTKIDAYLPELRAVFDVECEEWEINDHAKRIGKLKTDKGKLAVPRSEFNFGSVKQMQWLLFDKLKLPIIKKTESGAPAADYEVIEKLLPENPRLKTYKDYIDIKTVYNTFVVGLLEKVEEGCVYPGFNVNGTKTGRISHNSPNMGNMPTEGVYRNFFLPDAGCVIIGADFGQLEVVIEAHLTQDKNLRKIVLEGASKHDITAQALNIPRPLAKMLNFAEGYHCGVGKVSKILGRSWNEAQKQHDRYWRTYAGCRALKAELDRKVECGDPIVNMFGRERHLEMHYEEPWQLEAAKRQAYNFMIQGPGAELTSISLYRFHAWLLAKGYGRGLWTVHDEVVASVKKDKAAECLSYLKNIMDTVGAEFGLTLPLVCSTYGPLDHWAKA